VNHDGDLARAHALIDVAVQCGANAVKFQTFNADQLAAAFTPKAEYQLATTPAAESHREMLRRLELTPAAFGERSVDLLDSLGVAAFKIASGDITNLPLLAHVARKRRPILLSTGMASLLEVAAAVDALARGDVRDLVLLHCVSRYPADAADVNLRAIRTMAVAFQVPVGYSDHTLGLDVASASVVAGACVLEKHLTLNRSLPGPDQALSLEPAEFTELVHSVRRIEAALGHGRKEPADSELSTAAVARRSLAAACDIAAGEVLSERAITALRPGTGIAPAAMPAIVGRRARVAIAAGALIQWTDLQ
jgi:N-acetylneuraminate synthase/N,N'-diacetyllegionaminate synthase